MIHVLEIMLDRFNSGMNFAGIMKNIIKLLELQTILNQISLIKCTHTALTDMFHILKTMLKMYPKNCHLEIVISVAGNSLYETPLLYLQKYLSFIINDICMFL